MGRDSYIPHLTLDKPWPAEKRGPYGVMRRPGEAEHQTVRGWGES